MLISDRLRHLIDGWEVPHAAVGVTDATSELALVGDAHWQTRIASVSKLLITWAMLVAVEEGTVTLEEPAGPAGSTLRHLLAHASGLGFNDGDPAGSVGARRVYSNAGIEQ
ncbi:MAG: serine hydrolase, partial [Acidimicrobiales bacterium]|nr:serine hydrolase [Acidimicrobiales bacterium]